MRPHKKKRSEEVAFHFGKNLARLRRIAGLSQEELGSRASLHRTEIGMLEHGQRVARIDTVVKLAGAMAIEPQELLVGIHWTPRDRVGGGFSFSTVLFPPSTTAETRNTVSRSPQPSRVPRGRGHPGP